VFDMTNQSTRVRTHIVDTAERLFREGGEDATSLRAITAAAGVNVAAIHYHFGGRDQLLREVLDRRIRPLNERRLELLDAALQRRDGADLPVDELMEAFLRPDVELMAALRANEVQVARFLGRAYSQPSPVLRGFVEEQFRPVAARFLPLLARAVPHLSEGELLVRLNLVVGVVTGLFATASPLGEPTTLGSDDPDEQLRLLLAFFAPAIAAPAAILPDQNGATHVR
jgi:AcrR family transcriptional regulator